MAIYYAVTHFEVRRSTGKLGVIKCIFTNFNILGRVLEGRDFSSSICDIIPLLQRSRQRRINQNQNQNHTKWRAQPRFMICSSSLMRPTRWAITWNLSTFRCRKFSPFPLLQTRFRASAFWHTAITVTATYLSGLNGLIRQVQSKNNRISSKRRKTLNLLVVVTTPKRPRQALRRPTRWWEQKQQPSSCSTPMLHRTSRVRILSISTWNRLHLGLRRFTGDLANCSWIGFQRATRCKMARKREYSRFWNRTWTRSTEIITTTCRKWRVALAFTWMIPRRRQYPKWRWICCWHGCKWKNQEQTVLSSGPRFTNTRTYLMTTSLSRTRMPFSPVHFLTVRTLPS